MPIRDATKRPAKSRRAHVREALLEANGLLRARNPPGWSEKLDRIVSSPFACFRGTADLYFRDLAGTDEGLPVVLCNGDAHPENFGVMRGEGGELVFGPNDFDEAHPAPFSWDLRRSVTGFELLCRQRGLRRRDRKRVVVAVVDGYFQALRGYRRDKNVHEPRFVIGNSPGIIDDVLSRAARRSRRRFLDKRVDAQEGRLGGRDDIVSVHERVPEFQAALADYRARLGALAPERKRFFRVKDVAEKRGSGTGSLGLERYYVLIEGSSKEFEDDVILEIKEAVPSALAPHTAFDGELPRPEAARIVMAHEVQLAAGDPFFGYTEIGGDSFVVRERGEHKRSVNVHEADPEELVEYATVCGEALAQTHARCRLSKGTGRGSPAKQILGAAHGGELEEHLLEFASVSADRVEEDHGVVLQIGDELRSAGV